MFGSPRGREEGILFDFGRTGVEWPEEVQEAYRGTINSSVEYLDSIATVYCNAVCERLFCGGDERDRQRCIADSAESE